MYVDRRREQVVRARFAYHAPNSYSWFTEDGLTGVVTDGATHSVVINGSAAVAGSDGRASITHRFRNLLAGGRFVLDGWTLGEVTEGERCGRQVWIVESTPTNPGKEPMTVAFDQATCIVLSYSGRDLFTGFEEIDLDSDHQSFKWSGPAEQRKIGVAYVVEGHQTVGVSWQVHLPKLAAGYHRDESFSSKDEALRWAQERANEVVERD